MPRLAPAGWPAGALLWKNLAFVVRTGRARGTVLGFAVAALAVAGALGGRGEQDLLEVVGWLAAMWAGFLLILGPQWVRNDLRTDLSRLALLRSYPLRGKTVVGAETAGSTAVLTALQLGLIGIAYLAFWGGEVSDPSLELRTAVLAAAVVLLPAINFLAMLIQNGAALLLPAWVRVGSDRPIGVEALGQNMLVMSGFVAILAGTPPGTGRRGGSGLPRAPAGVGLVGGCAGRRRRSRRLGAGGAAAACSAGTGVRDDRPVGGAAGGIGVERSLSAVIAV